MWLAQESNPQPVVAYNKTANVATKDRYKYLLNIHLNINSKVLLKYFLVP